MGVATSYGRLRFGDVDGVSCWELDAVPHVMMRVRRIFPRADATRRGPLLLKDTPEVAVDLEWLLDRFPMRTGDATRQYLEERAETARETERRVADILGGAPPVFDGELLEPARPARVYQQQAADVAFVTGQVVIVDDVGLGKTMTAQLMLQHPETLPALFVTLTHLPKQMLGELGKTFPTLTGHILRAGEPYDPFDGTSVRGPVPQVLFTSYSKLARWQDVLAGRVRTVIYDEVQELRRVGPSLDRPSYRYTAATHIARKAQWRVGLTATPVYNYADEIHTVFDVVAPDSLGTRAEFLREWSGTSKGNNAVIRDAGPLGQYLRDQGLMLRRTRTDVGRELTEPVQVEQPVDTDHDAIAKAVEEIAGIAQLVLSTNEADARDRFKAAGELDWKLRHATGVAKAPYVAAFVRLLLESEQRVVLYGWHRDVYAVWLAALRDYAPALYTGSESVSRKADSVQRFLDDDDPCRVLILSLRSGAGLDGLQQAASVCVFGELDWSPGVHEQCIGRLWRDGQDGTVVAYYMVSDDGADPLMIEALGVKQSQAEAIRNPDKALVGRVVDPDRLRTLAAQVLERAKSTPAVDPHQPALPRLTLVQDSR